MKEENSRLLLAISTLSLLSLFDTASASRRSRAWTPETIGALYEKEHRSCTLLNAVSDCAIPDSTIFLGPSTTADHTNNSRRISVVKNKEDEFEDLRSSNFFADVGTSVQSHFHSRVSLVKNASRFAFKSATQNSLGAKLASVLHSRVNELANDDPSSKSQKPQSLLAFSSLLRYDRRRVCDCPEEDADIESDGFLTTTQSSQLIEHTDKLTENVLVALSNPSIWEKVNERDGVTVWRTPIDVKTYPNGKSDPDDDSVTIKSKSIIPYPPHKVYELLQNDDRVSEYNENCQQIQDVANLGQGSKINWSATGKFGPLISARDFVTLVCFKELGENEGYLSVASSLDTIREQHIRERNHSFLDECSHAGILFDKRPGYVRSQVQLAATFIRPVEGDSTKTELLQITQLGGLGGVADSPLAKKIKNNLEVQAPVDFVKKFSDALGRDEARVKQII